MLLEKESMRKRLISNLLLRIVEYFSKKKHFSEQVWVYSILHESETSIVFPRFFTDFFVMLHFDHRLVSSTKRHQMSATWLEFSIKQRTLIVIQIPHHNFTDFFLSFNLLAKSSWLFENQWKPKFLSVFIECDCIENSREWTIVEMRMVNVLLTHTNYQHCYMGTMYLTLGTRTNFDSSLAEFSAENKKHITYQ